MKLFFVLYSYFRGKQVLYCLIAFFISINFLKAQNKNIDSLVVLIKADQPDTNKVKHLYLLSFYYINNGLHDTGFSCNMEALQLAEKLNFKKGIAASYGNFGLFYKERADYPKALEFYFKALKIDEEIGNRKGISRHLGSIGTVYLSLEENSKALDYYLKALKITEEEGDKQGRLTKLTNIGSIYWKQHYLVLASEYYFKALNLAEELGDENVISTQLGNIGAVYGKIKNFNKALPYYFRSVKMAKAIGNKRTELVNIGNIGSTYTEQKKYKDAYLYLYHALAISDSIQANDCLKDNFELLGRLYETSNVSLPDTMGGKLLNMEQMRLRAKYYYRRSNEIKDIIFSQYNKNQLVQKEMTYEFEKKEEAVKASQSIKDAVAKTEAIKQRFIIILVTSLLIFVFLFAAFVFRSLRDIRKQKQIIENKSVETELQKKIIEEKNKDITDSIRYAKRIQNALLREEEHVSKHLPEHSIVFIPKDIVSGDFYWGAEKQDFWYFAVGDCTGHGVPGAVMSMLGISFLNDIVSPEGFHTPSEILNRLRDKMVKELRQTGEEGGSKDGMDISLARLNLKTYELQWAGANNAVTLILNGSLVKLKADKQPIGYYPQSFPFTNHKIQLQSGDSIYLYSDGYANQFGGPNDKKFTSKKLENLLIIYNHKPMQEQKNFLRKKFMEWKGTLEQIDDVCVFGVRVS
ncbi:MAG: tetratricopeptide repeat protein [Bacteroidota bacterium]